MKIAIIRQKFVLYGGAEQFVQGYIHQLAEVGHDIHIFANQWSPSNHPNIHFHHVPSFKVNAFIRTLSFAWFAARAVSKESFDIIQIGSKSTQEEREQLFSFQLNFDELLTGVNKLVDEIDEAIEELDGQINKSLNSSSESDFEKLSKKKGDIMDLKMILTGTRSLNYADVFSGSPPSVQRRLGNMSWELYNTTSKPTKTHEMTYKISKEKYEEILWKISF